MQKALILLLSIVLFSCSAQEETTEFTKPALAEKVIALDGSKTNIETVLNQYKGKTIVIDVWASWCGDCLKGLPLVKELQAQTNNDDVVYLFLSVDKKQEAWRKAITKRNIVGEHYFLPLGMKNSVFGDRIGLNWIPRYMVVGKDGSIKLFKAIKATDSNILAAIKADK